MKVIIIGIIAVAIILITGFLYCALIVAGRTDRAMESFLERIPFGEGEKLGEKERR
ncbi:MAG: hypothetical protein MRZ68_11370 [Lachnospira sp.]|nr:hypothetical protein [Lachnospira sp.]